MQCKLLQCSDKSEISETFLLSTSIKNTLAPSKSISGTGAPRTTNLLNGGSCVEEPTIRSESHDIVQTLVMRLISTAPRVQVYMPLSDSRLGRTAVVLRHEIRSGNFCEQLEQRLLNVRNIFRMELDYFRGIFFYLALCVRLKNKYEFFKSDDNFSIAFLRTFSVGCVGTQTFVSTIVKR